MPHGKVGCLGQNPSHFCTPSFLLPQQAHTDCFGRDVCLYPRTFFVTSVPQLPSPTSSMVPRTPLSHCYRMTSYLLLKTKQIFLQLVQLSWRFLELHLHKISMLVLFAVSLSEVSAGYWVLLAVSLLAVPLPSFSPLLYPLITTYVGLLATLKTIYQFPIISMDMFNLTRLNETGTNETQCYDLVSIMVHAQNSALISQCFLSYRTLHPTLVITAGQCLNITTHLVLGMLDGLAFTRCQTMLSTLQ